MSTRIGPYLVVRALAKGAQGAVSVAVRPGQEGVFAVKEFAPTAAMQGDPAIAKSRFEREVQVSLGLSHPNLVQTVDASLETEPPYLVSRYVGGVSLAHWTEDVEAMRVSVPIALRVMVDALGALEYLHGALDRDGERKVVAHRDVAPQNIIAGFDGVVRLIDLGLVRNQAPQQLTNAGWAIGTMRYMAPETAEGSHQMTAAGTDLYAVAAIGFELLSGVPLRPRGLDALKLATLARYGTLPEVAKPPEVPQGVWDAVIKGLEKYPHRRWKSAGAMRAALVSSAPEVASAEELGGWVLTHFSDHWAYHNSLMAAAAETLKSRAAPGAGSPATQVVARRPALPATVVVAPPEPELSMVKPSPLDGRDDLGVASELLMREHLEQRAREAVSQQRDQGALTSRVERARWVGLGAAIGGALGAVLGSALTVVVMRAIATPPSAIDPVATSVPSPTTLVARAAPSVEPQPTVEAGPSVSPSPSATRIASPRATPIASASPTPSPSLVAQSPASMLRLRLSRGESVPAIAEAARRLAERRGLGDTVIDLLDRAQTSEDRSALEEALKKLE